MKIKCKIVDNGCPHGLDVCCAVCDHRDNCGSVCTYADGEPVDAQNCSDAEVITDEPTQFQSAVPKAIQMITAVIQQKKELDEAEKQLKAELVKAMGTYGIKSFENDMIKMVYVAPTTRSTIDSARLKKDHPDIAEQYSKTSTVSASVRVTLK